jgi:hypothetical protein
VLVQWLVLATGIYNMSNPQTLIWPDIGTDIFCPIDSLLANDPRPAFSRSRQARQIDMHDSSYLPVDDMLKTRCYRKCARKTRTYTGTLVFKIHHF